MDEERQRIMIGVFDSGVGGLTVHRALVERLPQADFLYLADQVHTPYGGRPTGEIFDLTRAGCRRLFVEGASLVVLACNTAAAIALRPLQEEWLPEYRRNFERPINIIGLIVPTIEAATGMGWKDAAPQGSAEKKETIGIFATTATVCSDVYAVEIHKRRPDIAVVQEACPELARMIEAGADRNALRHIIEAHVKTLSERIGNTSWHTILGCTHYEIVADLFAEFLPPGTRLIHQPRATADALTRYLARHPEYDPGQSSQRRFITTQDMRQNPLAEEFWGGRLAFETLLAA
jgi:glutamate racemase